MNRAVLITKSREKIQSLEAELCSERMRHTYLVDPTRLYSDVFFKKRTRLMRRRDQNLGKVFVEYFEVKSLVDFGCGLGPHLEGALLGGVKEVLGFEIGYEIAKKYISSVVKPFIKCEDVGERIECGTWDCSFSIEVAEHLLLEQADAFVDNLVRASKRLIIVSASRSSRGYHLNAQEREYWIDKFTEQGVIHDNGSLDELKVVWLANKCPHNILDSLMFFRKESVDAKDDSPSH